MTKTKICGITTYEDALAATQAGADMLGLNFYPPSPRYVTPAQAREIVDTLRGVFGKKHPLLVGVFVNEPVDSVQRTIDLVRLDLAQLCGDEPVETLIALDGRAVKAIRPVDRSEALYLAEQYLPHSPTDDRFPALLLDAYHPDLYGGSGVEASVEVAQAINALTPRLMLAGGLTPDNVGERIAAIRPWGIDAASGVESPRKGRKDSSKVRAFIEAARQPILEAV
ncbi:MAG: phosphoribosylanthranilate isomerase [Anaerolineae bacterium]|nr:phosphoribosylanthranilate isomerase [Anaerolineae bacterium]